MGSWGVQQGQLAAGCQPVWSMAHQAMMKKNCIHSGAFCRICRFTTAMTLSCSRSAACAASSTREHAAMLDERQHDALPSISSFAVRFLLNTSRPHARLAP